MEFWTDGRNVADYDFGHRPVKWDGSRADQAEERKWEMRETTVHIHDLAQNVRES